MNRESISARQATIMIIVFSVASIAQFMTGLQAKEDAWLAVVLAIAAGALMALLYARILSILPGRDFFDTTEILIGKAPARIIWLLLSFFCLGLGTVLLANFGYFATINDLQNTPIEIMYLAMAVVCVVAVKLGVEALARSTYIFAFMVFFYSLFVTVLSSHYNDFTNLMPFLYNGMGPVLKGALGVLCYPFAEIVVFLLVFPAFKKSVSRYKVFMLGLLLSGFFILGINISVVSMMGPITVEQPLYASYKNLSVMKLGDFITRMEIFGIPVFCFYIFLNIVVPMLGACRGFARTFGINDYRILSWPVALLMTGIAMFGLGSILDLHKWFYDVFPYYAIVFEIAIPVILLVLVEIRYRLLRRRKELPAS